MRKITLALLFVVLQSPFAHSQMEIVSNRTTISSSQRQMLDTSLEEYQLVQMDIAGFKRGIAASKETDVLWRLGGGQILEMTLYPHEIRSPNFEAFIITEKGKTKREEVETITYKGYLKNGRPVRLTIDDAFIYGGFETEKGVMYVQQLRDFIGDRTISDDKLVLYMSDKLKYLEGTCGTEDVPEDKAFSTLQSNRSTSAGCSIIELQLHCDPQYAAARANSFAQMLGEINLIQDVWDDDLDAVLTVTSHIEFQAGGYTSFDPVTIINEIRNQWNVSSTPKDLIHLFTGKDLGGNLGRASGIGDACNDTRPVCYSVDRADVHETVSHEIGHLFDGRHGDGANCGIPGTRTMMCPGFDKDLNFSAASITRITNFLDNENCFNVNTTSISGTSNICVNNTHTYSLTNFRQTAGTTVTWSLNNSRATIVSGQGTSSVSVRGVSNGGVTLTAVINYPGNDCGSVTETKSITVGAPNLTISIMGPDYHGWIIAQASGGSGTHTWTLNGSTTWTSTSNTTSRYVGCNGGYLTVQASGSCGLATGGTGIPYGCSGGGFPLIVYPNPADNELNVQLDNNLNTISNESLLPEGPIDLTIFDMGGQVVKSVKMDGGTKTLSIEVSDLKKGNYFIRIRGGGIEQTHQVVIE
ncbi:T9SS type A sorting domain-containing protein [Flagellimonas algicola]|uniref:T9SS type A sorting domain-containing protein n=1 Tax=Flagellimonas algicola TaxID=2583815 RepID=A0ABY2WR22_9FLAO|nr:T9SS type A sorting domain-containing protein [Allomuricauda algicola]TMU57449.1 T9SS type A sorting domain-containing protein [Allomuricauda algicola]